MLGRAQYLFVSVLCSYWQCFRNGASGGVAVSLASFLPCRRIDIRLLTCLVPWFELAREGDLLG